MHAHREAARAEASGESSTFRRCGCGEEERKECPRCRGRGVMKDGPQVPGGAEEAVAALAEFVEAWSLIEKHGLLGWLAAEQGRDPEAAASADLPEALLLFDGELGRLEAEAESRRSREKKR